MNKKSKKPSRRTKIQTAHSGQARWNGMCPANKHGADFEGQCCDLCVHEAGGPCEKNCRQCHSRRSCA